VARPVLTVDQHDIRIAIAVVIDKSASRTHRLGQILPPECGIVVKELNPGLCSNVAKLNVLACRMNSRGHQAENEGKSKTFVVHGI
jgi:hypothetical protein